MRHPYDLAWARRVVASIPRPTPAEEDAAALDYAETALSEAWGALRRIRDGEPDPQRIAADLLDAHGFAPAGACPDDPGGLHHAGCGCEDSDAW